MDDGSAKCLLDVINDPNALQEFLRTNSQQDNGIHSKQSTSDSVSRQGFGNHLAASSLLNTGGLRTSGVASGLLANTRIASLGPGVLSNINSTTAPQSTFLNAAVNNNGSTRTTGSSTTSFNVGVVPSSVPVSSGVSFMKAPAVDGALNKGGSSVLGMSATPGNKAVTVNKPVVTSTAAFQGKKPIPIQPKTPNASFPVSSSTVGSPGNLARQVINSGVPLVSQQKQTVSGQQSISPVTHRVALNGVDSKANVKTNAVTGTFHTTKASSLGNSPPVISTTPVKRIAPKQPNILPQTGLSSPPQVVGTQHKILVQQVSNQGTPKLQTVINQVSAGTAQQSNHTQLIQAQQLLNLIRGQNSTNQTTPQASPQVVQSPPLPANQIKQIQQLVHQKLSNQQQQPQVVQTVQQKVLTPSQLQAALKQNQQLTTQMVQAPQTQNIVVQEEVIKQLLQQVAQQKSAQNVAQQQPQLFQQIQRPVQKQILVQNVQPQSAGQAQQNAHVQVSDSSQLNNTSLKQKTATAPLNLQLHQVLNNQPKPVHQVLRQQQVNLLPQQNIVLTKDQGATVLQGVTFVQNQLNTNSATQMVNQGGVVQQVKPVVQHSKAGTQPLMQIVTTAQQNTVPQTQQQQAQNTGVQKVFIIKQPELLQKLGIQGAKTQQAIQITPQQLQALKQLQLQQQVVKQKLVSGNVQTTANVQPKGLMADQLKQLQLQQQLQGTTVKQVVVQSRTSQPIIQQQRSTNVKTQQNKMPHVPRILQTSGRQPVSQSVKVSVPVKQETSKGVKRPHSSDSAEVPKVVTRLKQGLTADQQAVLRPDIKTPFTSHEDIVKRLTPYHVCYDPSPTPADVEKAEGVFSTVSTQLVKRSQKMMEKHRQLLFDESMREHPSAEMVMLYRVFLTNERSALADERKQAKENPTEFVKFVKKETSHKETVSSTASLETSNKDSVSSSHQTSTVTSASATQSDFVSSMKNTVAEVSTKISSLSNVNTSPPIKNSYTNSLSSKTEISSSTSSSSTRTHSSLVATSSSNDLFDSSPREIHQSSKRSAQPIDKALESHNFASVTREDLSVQEDSSTDIPMDAELEKEDVAATLALLNSMASELDEVLDVEGTL